jgi:pyridoxamine 5'-phosphate oxidase
MICIKDIDKSEPYKVFKNLYNESLKAGQKSIEAIAISSYDASIKEVDSRFVNLKKVENQNWIFYSNYESPKAKQFKSHPQISALFYWEKLNIQIRLKAKINILDNSESDIHFMARSDKKNAIAISSNQSKYISSYKKVEENYIKALKDLSLSKKRPQYWGGYYFKPYYFEFWEGHESRINKRLVYKEINSNWEKSVIQP